MASMPPLVAATLERYAALLRCEFGRRVDRVVLFGSHARGSARPGSDIDVLVVIRDLTTDERVRAIDLAYEASRQLGREAPIPTPLVWSDTEHASRLAHERRLALDIEREGLRL